MRKKLTFPIFLYFLLFILLFPKESSRITLATLLLWYRSVIPALLPSMIFIQFYLQSGDRKSVPGFWGVLLSLCCGFPVGSLMVISWMESRRIPPLKAVWYMAFLNQFSLSFLINYVSGQILQLPGKSFVLRYYVFQLVSYGILGILLLCVKHNSGLPDTNSSFCTKETLPFTDNSPTFGNAIVKSSEILLKLYGYMLICNLLSNSLTHLIPSRSFILLSGVLLEVTGGLNEVQKAVPYTLMPLVANATLSFGGICTILQVIPLIQKADLPIPIYILLKGAAAVLSTLMMVLSGLV